MVLSLGDKKIRPSTALYFTRDKPLGAGSRFYFVGSSVLNNII